MARQLDLTKPYGILSKAFESMQPSNNPDEPTMLVVPCTSDELRKKRIAAILAISQRWNLKNKDKPRRSVKILKMPRRYTINALMTENQSRSVITYLRKELGIEAEIVKEADADYAVRAVITFGDDKPQSAV